MAQSTWRRSCLKRRLRSAQDPHGKSGRGLPQGNGRFPHRARLGPHARRISVDYYGSQMPLNQIAQVHAPEPQTDYRAAI